MLCPALTPPLAETIAPAVRTTLLRQMDVGFLTCAQMWVSVVHTKGSGPVRHKKVCTKVDSEQ